MNNAGSNTNSNTSATTSNKEAIKRLKSVQQRLWAIMGLKMATDRLRDLGYDVVVQSGENDGCTTIKVDLKIKFDFDSGTVNGKDIMASQEELQKQIERLEGKSNEKKK